MIEEFGHSGDAYNASNSYLETGTVIVVEPERVVGLAWAWPIAITKEGGKFHDINIKPEMSRAEMIVVVRRVMVDAQISWADVKEAYMAAVARGWPIQPWVVAVAHEREWAGTLEG